MIVILNSRLARLQIATIAIHACSQSKKRGKRVLSARWHPFPSRCGRVVVNAVDAVLREMCCYSGFLRAACSAWEDSVPQNAAHSGRNGNCCEDRLQAAAHETSDPVLFFWVGRQLTTYNYTIASAFTESHLPGFQTRLRQVAEADQRGTLWFIALLYQV